MIDIHAVHIICICYTHANVKDAQETERNAVVSDKEASMKT